MPNRDVQFIRVIGGLILGVGLLLGILTVFVGIIAVVSIGAVSLETIVRGALGLALSMLMSISMASCGTELERVKPYTRSGIENMRLIWTSLLVLMVLAALAGYWLVPALSVLAIFVIIGLVLIRGAVIRLTE